MPGPPFNMEGTWELHVGDPGHLCKNDRGVPESIKLVCLPSWTAPGAADKSKEPSGRLGSVWSDLARSRSDLEPDDFHTSIHTSCSHLSGWPGWLFQRVERATEMSEPPGIIPIRPGERTEWPAAQQALTPLTTGPWLGGVASACSHLPWSTRPLQEELVIGKTGRLDHILRVSEPLDAVSAAK